MKFIRLLCLVICILALLPQLYIFAAEDASVSSGSHSVNASVPLSENKKLLETSNAVVLYEQNSDTMVYGWNLDEKIYPSSMVKLMTAILALEKGTLTDVVTVTKSALSYVPAGSVSSGLKNGEEISLESLLYCLMVAGTNDAAAVIAEHIGGSQESFLQMMNDKAKEIGCTGTNYTNTHGVHDEMNYTTARDICKILAYGLENAQFEQLFSAKNYTVPATNKSEERPLSTSNYMVNKDSKYFDERVTGGKTGYTKQAGRCLAVTAEANGMKLIGIVMGAVPTYQEEGVIVNTFGSFEEMKVLLDFACNGFEYRQIFYENQALAQYAVTDGANDVVTKPGAALSTVLPVKLDENKLRWVFEDTSPLIAPIIAGQHIANVQVWYEDICLAQTQMVAMNDVSVVDKTSNQSVNNPALSEGDFSLWSVVGVIAAILVLAMLLRWFAAARAKARRQKRRAQRRREW